MTTKDFNTPILNLDGSTVKEGLRTPGSEIPSTRDLTVARAIIASLENPLKGDESLTHKQIYINMVLAERVHNGGDVKLDSEEVTLIKERVAKTWPAPIVIYRITQFLEG